MKKKKQERNKQRPALLSNLSAWPFYPGGGEEPQRRPGSLEKLKGNLSQPRPRPRASPFTGFLEPPAAPSSDLRSSIGPARGAHPPRIQISKNLYGSCVRARPPQNDSHPRTGYYTMQKPYEREESPRESTGGRERTFARRCEVWRTLAMCVLQIKAGQISVIEALPNFSRPFRYSFL